MDKHPLRIALETLDVSLLEHSLSEDVVFWTPLLTSTVSGRDSVKRILLTAGAGFGPFQITGEFIDEGTPEVREYLSLVSADVGGEDACL